MIWLILGMALVTFLTRAAFIVPNRKADLPEPVARALSFSPPAVLSAIVVTAVAGIVRDAPNWPEAGLAVLCIGAAMVISQRSGNLLLAITIGLAGFMIGKSFA